MEMVKGRRKTAEGKIKMMICNRIGKCDSLGCSHSKPHKFRSNGWHNGLSPCDTHCAGYKGQTCKEIKDGTK
ncbi:hypothetical protein LCGC14_1117320 [marine sediment metagenome]|uniref:Uncharacterized protein n=1 Tax=marine sediment metagenome TaxID=412755 RepID=A0A0F9M4W2_9ZZZZ